MSTVLHFKNYNSRERIGEKVKRHKQKQIGTELLLTP